VIDRGLRTGGCRGGETAPLAMRDGDADVVLIAMREASMERLAPWLARLPRRQSRVEQQCASEL